MGKTPLREALIRLHGEALVCAVPKRGFFAKTLAAGEMKERYEFAFLVLRHAILKNVAGFSLRGIDRPMEAAWDEGGRLANAGSELFLSHAMFIEALYERIATLSDNRVMIDSIRGFNDQTRYVRLIDLDTDRNIREIATDMVDLVGALERREADRAVANLERQLEKKLTRMEALVNEGNLRALRLSGP